MENLDNDTARILKAMEFDDNWTGGSFFFTKEFKFPKTDSLENYKKIVIWAETRRDDISLLSIFIRLKTFEALTRFSVSTTGFSTLGESHGKVYNKDDVKRLIEEAFKDMQENLGKFSARLGEYLITGM